MKNNKLKDKRIELLNGIYNYFNNGGFFNPEMMQHDKVRNMLLEIRTYLETEKKIDWKNSEDEKPDNFIWVLGRTPNDSFVVVKWSGKCWVDDNRLLRDIRFWTELQKEANE